MKISSWNVNSVRARIENIIKYLKDSSPDVLMIQEIKTEDKNFPYEVIKDLGKQKTKNLHVICPGFSSDCLETLEEINMEGKSIFLENGGKNYDYIPALNNNSYWIESMGEILNSNLQGWIDQKWSLVNQQKKSALTKKQAEKFK